MGTDAAATPTDSDRLDFLLRNRLILKDDGGCNDPECCGGPSYWSLETREEIDLEMAANGH